MVKESLDKIKAFERALVEDDSYIGEIKNVSEVYATTNYVGKDVEKVRFDVEIETEGKEKVILPLFMNATISDAGENNNKYRNSRLYDFLVQGDQMKNYMKIRDAIFKEGLQPEESNAIFVDFLRKVFKGKKVKALTKTVVPSKGDDYSVISEVLKFI